uniref:PA domain-containing protein n=1 Tax=Peronospora matthiolae TaxID=2874970 RepID=A0AAV1T6Y5_9STRA
MKINNSLVVIDRGNCSFATKALRAQAAGASGVIIRGTKKAVFEAIACRNDSDLCGERMVSIREKTMGNHLAVNGSGSARLDKPVFEYDCSHGQAFVDKLATPVWRTDSKKCSSNLKCKSRSCVLTGHSTFGHVSGTKHQVCCMWDTFVLMGTTNKTMAKALTIPVVYVTISDGQKLQRVMDRYSTLSLVARTYRRELPIIDVSSMLLWALGVATAIGAACYSARVVPMYDDSGVLCGQENRHIEQEVSEEEDRGIWELDVRHAVGFIVLAGVILTVLYFVNVAAAIPVLFAVSAAASMTQVVATPALEKWMPELAARKITLPHFIGDTARLSELLGLLPSCTLAIVWYLHRRDYWILQDIMGICLCFVFLRSVQLPNLKVATVFLTLGFFYDVFFVFLSPIFFGSSVMEDVATGGPAAYTKSGYPGIDYCERYPQYQACVDPEPMPMLLVMPRMLNWAGGVSMLGLGDIVLPGMLLSLALRFDDAQGTTNYFRLMGVGYAVGLALANLAVTITQMGQPALMYLVPTTLGTLIVASKRNGDFNDMWTGVGVDETRRSGQGSGYRAVGSEEGYTGSTVVDTRDATSSLSDGDHVPLLRSLSS